MSTVADCIPFYSDADLPFGPTDPAPESPLHAVETALEGPIYVGCVEAGQRGVLGPISLELLLDRDRIELGPFVLPRRQAARLWRLLALAVAVLDPDAGQRSAPASRPAPLPESGRGITGWDLARNLTGLAAAGCPWEGETLP